MSFISQIALNLDLLAQNISRLQEQAATLPSQSAVAVVQGARTEAAQDNYARLLGQLMERVGAKTEQVRMYVENNAASLQRAADVLQQTDGDQSLAARQAAAFVDAVAADAAATPAPVAPPAPGRPGSAPQPW